MENHLNTNSIVMLPIKELHPHPKNPRKDLGDLTELADSIKVNGVMQNLTVVAGHYISGDERDAIQAAYDANPTQELRDALDNGWLPTEYTIVIGHRRCAASELAGLTHLPCVIVTMTVKAQVKTMLLENLQREDLSAYEQTQGFQMMLDLGETVETIVKKTGFSKKTVKRSLQMAELDQEKLRKVSDRQISMSDFDMLAKLDDVSQRNICLSQIGTPNFDLTVKQAIKKQNIAKNLPTVKDVLRQNKAKKITVMQGYSGGYRQIGDTICIDELTGVLTAPDTEGKKLYYTLDESSGTLRFYVEVERKQPTPTSQEEIERKKVIAEANETCQEISRLCKELREEFVKKLSLNSKNQEAMLSGAIMALITEAFKYRFPANEKMCELAGVERQYGDKALESVSKLLMDNAAKSVPAIIYEAFHDDDECYHTNFKNQYPKHTANARLDCLYKWLISVGYVMSDTEIAMQNGTHEIFKDPAEGAEAAIKAQKVGDGNG